MRLLPIVGTLCSTFFQSLEKSVGTQKLNVGLHRRKVGGRQRNKRQAARLKRGYPESLGIGEPESASKNGERLGLSLIVIALLPIPG